MNFEQLSEQTVRLCRVLFTGVLCAALLLYGYRSIHWQVVWDPSIMHYVNFLMAHGMAPYRDIVDINLPGSYFMDRFAMFLFGGGDLSWRIYEFCLLGLLIASMTVISRPIDWFAGFSAGALVALHHAIEGARDAGQREQLMTALILAGYAFLFTALRRRVPVLMLFFGVALGLAASLKPTAFFLVAVLPAMAVLALRKQGLRYRAYLGYALAGLTAALLINVWFFWHYHDFYDYIAVSRRLVTYYASVGNDTPYWLIRAVLSNRALALWLITGAFMAVNVRRTAWERMERNMLLAGVLFGAISFLSQRKIFEHHLYTYVAMLLLVTTIELARAWRTPGWRRVAGLLVFAFIILYRVRNIPTLVTAEQPMQEQELAIRHDLHRLGNYDALQHQILCLDLVSGCYSALYHEKILPYSGLVADYMLFAPEGYKPITYYRDKLWPDLQRTPPKVIIVTDMWLCSRNSFDKLKQWPAIISYLETNYIMISTVKSGFGTYRLYVNKSAMTAGPTGQVPAL